MVAVFAAFRETVLSRFVLVEVTLGLRVEVGTGFEAAGFHTNIIAQVC